MKWRNMYRNKGLLKTVIKRMARKVQLISMIITQLRNAGKYWMLTVPKKKLPWCEISLNTEYYNVKLLKYGLRKRICFSPSKLFGFVWVFFYFCFFVLHWLHDDQKWNTSKKNIYISLLICIQTKWEYQDRILNWFNCIKILIFLSLISTITIFADDKNFVCVLINM